ncbi:19530_t:CDS:2 [Dentiscutata erythropus]|uniref:19530_t:CDS:1 n=1 Tax=Dentiscutata erythropus TaxID=1348616 RepID=A0A9N9F029_9GLOM|nr:19530_t:CDS:2 [Dentiscutata erythropus]
MPFGYYLIEGITKMMFQKLNSIKPGTSAAIQFQCWQREVSKVLSLSKRLPEASTFASLHLLQVCHNFVSADPISISNMKEIMKAGKGSKGPDIFNQKFIETIFSLMKKLPNNNENSILKLSFINECLDMVPKNSPSHKDLYQNMFSQKPFHFMSPIIIRVLKCEEKDSSFTTLHSLNNKASFNLFFTSLKKKDSADKSLIALIGFIISRLHIIRASRDWTEEEKKIAEFLKEKVDHSSVPSTIYKQTINNIISNNHSLLRINQNVTNSELLVKSVIGHVIALHASIPAESTPLAYMLHNLNNCSDLFIPTCVSDTEVLDSNKDNEPLSLYFGDPTLNLWASWINEEVVDNCFPENLLVKHIFEAFMLVSARIEAIKKQLPSATKTAATNSPPITKVVTSKKAPKTISKSTSTLFATRKSNPKISSSSGARSLEATASKTQLTKTSTSQVQKKDTVKKG